MIQLEDGAVSLHLKGSGMRGSPEGWATGEAIRIHEPISFLGDVDSENGTLLCPGHEGEGISGKILLFPEGRGSTVGSYVIYNLKISGHAPSAMVMEKSDAVVAIGCIVAGIPLVHGFKTEELMAVRTGDMVRVNGATGEVEVFSKKV